MTVGSAMSNAVQSTKSFFKDRPVRIVLALIVITAIMVGAGFGFYELIKAIQSPCINQPGTILDPNTGKCIQASCPEKGAYVCNNPDEKTWYGKCVPANYCTAPYVNDKDSCQCTRDCGSGFEPYGTIDNKENAKTSMYIRDGGSTYEPTQDLVCGYPCEYATTSYCEADKVCGIYRTYNPIDKTTSSDYGCFDSSYAECGIDDVVCPDKSSCSSVEINGSKEEVCWLNICGSNSNNVVPCTQAKDCFNSKKVPKDISSSEVCTGEFIGKGFQNVKFCNKTDILENNNNCYSKDEIGEDVSGGIVMCDGLSGITNKKVSGEEVQCQSAIKKGGCAKYGICSNKWQANPNSSPEEYCSSATKPEPIDMGDCCPSGTQATDPTGKKFCCTITGDPYCLNITQYPYSKKYLTGQGSLREPISCSSGEDLSSLSEQFYKSLGISKEEATNYSSPEYSGLYCSGDEIYAYCGQAYGNIDFAVTNLPSPVANMSPISFCANKTKCTFDTTNYRHGILNLGPKNNNTISVPRCVKENDLYWSSPNRETGFSTQITGTLSQSCNKKQEQACGNSTFANLPSVTDVTYKNVNGTGTCIFDVVCDNYRLDVPKTNGSSSEMEWSDLNDPNFYASNSEIDINQIFSDFKLSSVHPFSPGEQGNYCLGRSSFDKFTSMVSGTERIQQWNPNSIVKSPQYQKIGTDACSSDDLTKLLSNDGKYCTAVDISTGLCS